MLLGNFNVSKFSRSETKPSNTPNYLSVVKSNKTERQAQYKRATWSTPDIGLSQIANKDWIVFNTAMVINVQNKTADRLTREFATLANVSLTDAIIIAMREAIGRRITVETPIQTAARIREKYNLKFSDETKIPLPKEVFDDMWEA